MTTGFVGQVVAAHRSFVLRRLTGLDDDTLPDVLTRLCRRLWVGATA